MAISRRAVLLSGLAAGGGLAAWYVVRVLDDGDAASAFGATTPEAVPLNAWVKIAPDGSVIVGVHRAEMGQGVTTALPMMLAEELDVDWERVRFEFTPVDRDYYNFGVVLRGQPFGDTTDRPLARVGERALRGAFHAMGLSMTVSSSSVVDAWDTVRLAGATARAALVAAAARRWGVPADGLETLSGRVVDPVSGRNLGYGELAAEAAQGPPPGDARAKDPKTFRLVGTSPPRLDIPAKVTGSAGFGIDTRRPGMLFATVRSSPLVGTRLAGLDNAAEVSAMPGVEGVVRLGDRAVAVVARDTWSAMRGAARLSLQPEPVDRPVDDTDTLIARMRAGLDDADAAVFREEGDAPGALAESAAVVEAHFELPWLAHVCMEPMSCSALVEDGSVTVWAPTQAEGLARDLAAEIAGVDRERVTVHRTFLGGGLGRRSETDFVGHAVGAAKAFPGRPVQLVYSREEDLHADMYRPAAVARVRATLAGTRLQALDYVVASQSVAASHFRRTPTAAGGDARKDSAALSGGSNFFYAAGPVRFAFVPQDYDIPVGFWRSVGHSLNCFFVEAFMDELAAAAGEDPLAFRLAHLDALPKHATVLRRAAELAGWGMPLAPGRGRGVSLVECHDSIVAQVVEVTTGQGREFRVDRITCVIDPRTVIHPDTVVAQMQGGIVDGLSAALYGRVTFRAGGVEQTNFDDYRLVRLAETPEIVVELMPQGGRPGGAGEPGVPGVAPALVNALFAAMGRRIRRLPLLA